MLASNVLGLIAIACIVGAVAALATWLLPSWFGSFSCCPCTPSNAGSDAVGRNCHRTCSRQWRSALLVLASVVAVAKLAGGFWGASCCSAYFSRLIWRYSLTATRRAEAKKPSSPTTRKRSEVAEWGHRRRCRTPAQGFDQRGH